MIAIGDKVIYRGEHWGSPVSVTGTVIEDHGNTVVIEDDHAETEDSRLEFKKSQVKLLEEVA
jgi:ribosomal protein L35AE/L33A